MVCVMSRSLQEDQSTKISKNPRRSASGGKAMASKSGMSSPLATAVLNAGDIHLNTAPRSLFAKNVGHALQQKGLSAHQIAHEVGLDANLVNRVLNGSLKPSKCVLQQLSLSPSMGLSYKTLITWCLLDDYSPVECSEPSVFLG